MTRESSETPHVTEVSATELNALLRETDRPVLAYIWAPWCPPCKTMTPAMDDVAARIGANTVVVKLNAVTESHALTAFNISSVPTLLLFSSDGQLIARQLGALTASSTLAWVDAKVGIPS